MKIMIRQSDFDKILEHALNVRPEEACGLIAGEDGEDGIRRISKVYILTNSDHTNEHFTIDPKEQLAAIKDMRADGIKPLGNWHSHPESPSRPSEEDKKLANDSKASYLILSLMEEGKPVLNAFHIESQNGEKIVRKEELSIV
ncbi:MAG: M67 family metallopeptidase [Lachnospiraceae bacterium]|nr:M67 family metallopeptidase [Lachnospiraceae bacterium]